MKEQLKQEYLHHPLVHNFNRYYLKILYDFIKNFIKFELCNLFEILSNFIKNLKIIKSII
jgi:hypothetical protein